MLFLPPEFQEVSPLNGVPRFVTGEDLPFQKRLMFSSTRQEKPNRPTIQTVALGPLARVNVRQDKAASVQVTWSYGIHTRGRARVPGYDPGYG